MKNEYFQENLEKSIKITREMILFDDPNEIIERKSKSEGKWLPFEGRKRIRITSRMTLFDDENTKLTIIFIYEGNGIKNRASILSIWTRLFQILNQGGGGKTIIFKVVNLDSSIRIQTTHNGYLYHSPDQGLQSLGLGFFI